MARLSEEFGFVRGVLLLFVLLVLVGMFYLTRRRGVDVADAGKQVATDLEKAAESVKETSEDAFLTAKVKTALSLSKSASALDFDVDSHDGAVTVTGAVPSEQAKETALKVVRDTEGVLSVVDRVHVDPGVASAIPDDVLEKRLADLEIETAIYERLLHEDGLDARSIRVSVDGRVVRLTGSVPDLSQKERVAALAASVEGVHEVRDELQVSNRAAQLAFPVHA